MTTEFQLQNSFAFWLHRLNGALQEQFNEQLKTFDITWPQWMLLNVLSDQTLTPAQIAEQLGVDRSAITRLLDRLEKKEYVEREHDRLDRRSVNIRMTGRGLEHLKDINELAHKHQQSFLQDLHLSERRGMKKELQKILKTVGLDTTTLWQRID